MKSTLFALSVVALTCAVGFGAFTDKHHTDAISYQNDTIRVLLDRVLEMEREINQLHDALEHQSQINWLIMEAVEPGFFANRIPTIDQQHDGKGGN